jgi:hypothetical protein
MKLYLYHYYELKQGPFRNLSSLELKEAKNILQRLKKDEEVFASQRADDYLIIRRELESKARTVFLEKGGTPRTSYPHYMTLGPCEWIKSWYRHGSEIKIPVEEFDERTISFTYGDLFPTMRYKDGKAYREQVYTKQEILSIIDEYGFPQDWNEHGNKGPERYIEAQIWDEEIIRKHSTSS